MKLIDNESLDRQIGVVAEVAGYLWERGWAERNGGNISVNVTGLCADAVCELPALDGPYLLPKPVPHIAGGCFLVTGTGRRMRYVASQPLANVALIRVAADGASYEIVADEPVRPPNCPHTSRCTTIWSVRGVPSGRWCIRIPSSWWR